MEAGLRVRRARRGDFERVRSLLGTETPAARADRKRFRRLVSTLREDLYLVERADDASLAGLALIAYFRGLGPPTAVVRRLLGDSEPAARLLLECARARAAARGCARLEVQVEPGHGAWERTFEDSLRRVGWTDGPRTLVSAVHA
jgi:hypothetical protein